MKETKPPPCTYPTSVHRLLQYPHLWYDVKHGTLISVTVLVGPSPFRTESIIYDLSSLVKRTEGATTRESAEDERRVQRERETVEEVRCFYRLENGKKTRHLGAEYRGREAAGRMGTACLGRDTVRLSAQERKTKTRMEWSTSGIA